jgi:hypothetical protein
LLLQVSACEVKMEVWASFRFRIITQDEYHHSGASQMNNISIGNIRIISSIRSITQQGQHHHLGASLLKGNTHEHSSSSGASLRVKNQSGASIRSVNQDQAPASHRSITQEHPHSGASALRSITPPGAPLRSILSSIISTHHSGLSLIESITEESFSRSITQGYHHYQFQLSLRRIS